MDYIIHFFLFYLIDSVTLHITLKNHKFFDELVFDTYKVSTIAILVQKIESSGRTYIMLSNCIQIFIKEYYF